MIQILHLHLTKDQHLYSSILQHEDLQSAFLRLDYMKAFCGGLEHLICFYYQHNEQIIVLPGYLKPIHIYQSEKMYFDFCTPYGYTGPHFTAAVTEATLAVFWEQIHQWQQQNKVVAEFIRFNLFNNSKGYQGTLHQTMCNIKGQILPEAVQWASYDPKVRKNVKRAQSAQLKAVFYEESIPLTAVEEFYTIYIETMKRTQAKDFFFYSFEDVLGFVSNNADVCALCTIYDQDTPISTELLLLSHEAVFSFLGGTFVEYFDKRPNDFLKFEVTNWARNKAIKNYVLGGGHSENDGIFKYKKCFFPSDVVHYATGRSIINAAMYDLLVQEVNEQKEANDLLVSTDLSFFPLYNKQ